MNSSGQRRSGPIGGNDLHITGHALKEDEQDNLDMRQLFSEFTKTAAVENHFRQKYVYDLNHHLSAFLMPSMFLCPDMGPWASLLEWAFTI